jgi:hypothetical protein
MPWTANPPIPTSLATPPRFGWFHRGVKKSGAPGGAAPPGEIVEIAFEPRPDERERLTKPIAGRVIAVGMRELDTRMLLQQGLCTVHVDNADLSDLPYFDRDVSPSPWQWR